MDILVSRPEEVETRLQCRDPFYLHHVLRGGRVVYDTGLLNDCNCLPVLFGGMKSPA